jgi:hypothetical protein
MAASEASCAARAKQIWKARLQSRTLKPWGMTREPTTKLIEEAADTLAFITHELGAKQGGGTHRFAQNNLPFQKGF